MKCFLWFLIAFLPCHAEKFRIIDAREFPRMGMFAFANQILGQLYIYESKKPVEIDGLLVNCGTFGLYYDADYGPNWWNYYFEPLCLGNVERADETPLSKEHYFQAFKKRRELTRVQAAELVKKYIHVKELIHAKVQLFATRYFKGLFTIGIHYRGTDKQLEAPRVCYKQVFDLIEEHLPSDREWQLFVATDESCFLEAIQNQFPGRVIFCDAERSKGDIGVHFLKGGGYKKGEEALIDALLLSKCDILIRTSSNLSLWSTYFNPHLQTVLLNSNFKSHLNAEVE